MAKHENNIGGFVNVAKALGDETRVRLLLALVPGEVCVCQLIELAGLAPSTVSKHLTILKQAGLIRSRKIGRWIFYRLPEDEVPPLAAAALQWAQCCLLETAPAKQDKERLEAILKQDPSELSRSQCCR